MSRLQKELLIFFVILFIMAIIQHKGALIGNFAHLHEAVVYGMGPFHPLAFALIGYLVIGVFRLIAAVVKKILGKKEA